jgi:hypothetical protein
MHGGGDNKEPVLARNRSLEIVTAIIFLGTAAVFLLDALRLGHRWIDGLGPGPGYFPFYLALVLAAASLVNLARAVLSADASLRATFTTLPAAGRVLTVLLPAIAYVALIGGVGLGPVVLPGLGIYVASAIFITFFMIAFGGESVLRAVLVGILVPLAFFLVFEKWFLVPLPKGPLEALLGLA